MTIPRMSKQRILLTRNRRCQIRYRIPNGFLLAAEVVAIPFLKLPASNSCAPDNEARSFREAGLTSLVLRPAAMVLVHGLALCSALPSSDLGSRRRLCALLSLHFYQVVKKTFTFQLADMLGRQKRPTVSGGPNISIDPIFRTGTSLLTPSCVDHDQT